MINQEYVFKCFVRLYVAHFGEWYTEALMSGNKRRIEYLDHLIHEFKAVAVDTYNHVVNHDDDCLTDFVIAQNYMIGYFKDNYFMFCEPNGHLGFDDSSVYAFTGYLESDLPF